MNDEKSLQFYLTQYRKYRMAHKFYEAVTRPSIRGLILKELIQVQKGPSAIKQTSCKALVKPVPPSSYLELPLSLAALNINSIWTPPYSKPPKARIPPSLPLSRIVELPQIQKNVTYEDQSPTTSVQDPSPSSVQEKQAARLIVIRRQKMKKHKLRKLRRKMKFAWAKVRQKRELKKEKLFQAGLIEKIKLAQSFDPAKYAAEKIAKANTVELPEVWHGVKYPDFIMKQLLDEKEQKEKQKEADERRRASMSPYVKDYLEKLPK